MSPTPFARPMVDSFLSLFLAASTSPRPARKKSYGRHFQESLLRFGEGKQERERDLITGDSRSGSREQLS